MTPLPHSLGWDLRFFVFYDRSQKQFSFTPTGLKGIRSFTQACLL